jgi:SH3-like domain-containing protein
LGILFGASAFAADEMFMVENVQAKRFINEDIEGPFLSSGTRVNVVIKEGDWVRVRNGESFGWVRATNLSETEPAAVVIPE